MAGRPCLPCLAMDQDYERRLLRQIVIQNENTMPCVSARPARWPRGAGGETVGVWSPLGFSH